MNFLTSKNLKICFYRKKANFTYHIINLATQKKIPQNEPICTRKTLKDLKICFFETKQIFTYHINNLAGQKMYLERTNMYTIIVSQHPIKKGK